MHKTCCLSLFFFVSLSAFADPCSTGYQKYGERCVTQRMADYISCVEATGGNRQELIDEVSKFGGQKASASGTVSAQGPVVGGSASATLGKADEESLKRRIESRWFTNGANECSKVLDGKPPKPVALGRLSLVDARIHDPEGSDDHGFPSLDILLRNTGKVAVIKKALIEVSNVWQVQSRMAPFAMPQTWKYTVQLPISGAPYVQKVDLAQEIGPGGTDRFSIILGNDAPPSMSTFVFVVRVTLLYDEDDKALKSGNLIFIASPAVTILAASNINDAAGVFIHNRAIAGEIQKIKGVRSARAEEFVKQLTRDVVPELTAALGHPDPDHRKFAAEFLGRLGPSAAAAIPALQLKRDDPDVGVAAAVSHAIEQIRTPGGGDVVDLHVSRE